MKILVFLLLLPLFILSGCINKGKESGSKEVISVSGLESLIRQKDYSLIYLWTTWCGPCRKTLAKTLPVIQKKLSEDNAQMLVVAISKDDQKINEIIRSTGLHTTYRLSFNGPDFYFTHKIVLKTVLNDLFPGQQVWRNSVPVFFLVDRNMNVLIPKIPTDLPTALKLLEKNSNRPENIPARYLVPRYLVQ